MIGVGGSALYAIAFMAAGVVLTVIIFGVAALIVVGHFKPSRRMQRAGLIVFVIWVAPAAVYTYYLRILTEPDQYRILAKPEVVYGVPLPAGAQVNYRRWAQHVQWAVFHTPQMIQGVDYIDQVNFCGSRICSGTLARDQDIQGLPCSGRTEVHFSETTGALTWCTLARPTVRQGATWPAGTLLDLGAYPSYVLPQGALPVRVAGLLVHSGLTVQFSPSGRISEIHRDEAQRNPDTLLEAGGILLKSDQYRFLPDGAIQGGILARDAIINGKPAKAGDPVVISQPPATTN